MDQIDTTLEKNTRRVRDEIDSIDPEMFPLWDGQTSHAQAINCRRPRELVTFEKVTSSQ